MLKHSRYTYIDLLKVFAIFMVVSLHCHVWNTNFVVQNNFQTVLQYFVRLSMEGVPLFMFVNGFLLFGKNIDINKHLKKH